MNHAQRVVVLLMVICLLTVSLPTGCRKAAEKTAEKVVSGGKEAIGGISEGIEKGRKQSGGTDDAIIISTADELAAHSDVSVFRLVASAESEPSTTVEFAIVNRETRPLELTGLHKLGSCAVIDSDGFFTPLDQNSSPSSFEVLPQGKQKLILHFKTPNNKAAQVLLYAKKYSLTGAGAGTETQPASKPATKPE